MLGIERVIANRTDVIRYKPSSGIHDRIIGHNGTSWFFKGCGVDEGEVTLIEKTLYMTSCSGVHGHTIGKHVELVGVFPFPKRS